MLASYKYCYLIIQKKSTTDKERSEVVHTPPHPKKIVPHSHYGKKGLYHIEQKRMYKF